MRFRSDIVGIAAVITAILCAGAAAVAHADTGLGRHKTLYAVPTPGKMVIDGKLDDWDLSAQIYMYVTSETAEMQSARFAVMYDAEALYLSGIVRDPSPLMNRHDPAVDGNKGWDADACQFRLSVNPSLGYPVNVGFGQGAMEDESLVHLILWHYTDRQEACLQMHASMKYKSPRREWDPFGVVPAKFFDGKYVKAEDGHGYTFEYRIPWATLGAKTLPKAGDLLAGTVQFNWGTPDGLKTGGSAAWCYDVMSQPGFPYQQTGCWGKMILSAKGGLPKDLIEEGLPPEKPLPLKFAYSLPDESQATVQIFSKSGEALRTLVAQANRPKGESVELWDGMNDSGQPLRAGEYVWKGIYHQPITQKFLFSVHNSGQPPYHTDDNTGSWGGDHGVPTTACAFGDGVLLAWNACEAGFGILRTDFSGKRLWGSKHCATYLAADAKRFFAAGDDGFDKAPGVRVFELADGRPLNFGNGHPQLLAPPGGDEKTDEITGLAYRDGSVYVAYAARNLVARFDAVSGDLKETFNVPAPARLAARPGPNSGLALISGTVIVSLSGGKVAPLGADHLDNPRGIAVGADGAIYVANGGKLQNVSVFAVDGKYQRSIGKPGGRPAVGDYDKTGMLEPGGIAVDAKNQLWVAEQLDAPKRYSQWDAGSGNLALEFFGGSDYFGYGWMDPRKPDEMYVHNVLWKIDWTRNSATPVSTIWRPTKPNMMTACSPSGYNGRPRFFTAKNGKQFCWGLGSFSSILSMREGNVYKPIAAFISVSRGNVYFGDKAQFELMNDEKKYPNGCYFWQDRNNDQTIQADELVDIRVLAPKYPKIDFRWFSLTFAAVEADLTAWLRGPYLLKPASFESDGRPVFDLTQMQETALTNNQEAGGEMWLDPDDGSIYTQTGSLAKWSRDGKQIWTYSYIPRWHDCLSRPMQAPGRLWGLTNNLGVAGDFTGNSCYFGTFHLLTRDGIYVAMIMRDGRAGGLGPDVTASETLTGQLVKPDGMNRYFLIGGASDARVTEILGLDTIKRLPGGTFTLSEADFQLASRAQSEYAAKLAKGRRLALARGRQAIEVGASVSRAYESTRSFTVHAAYDEKNLYVSYDVTSPHELVNAVADPRLIFKGGNCLDIQLATDPAADPKRKTPAAGDVRILITRQQGKPAVVLFRPKVKDFNGTPIVLTSPTGKESFDAIETTDRVTLEYTKNGSGFKAVAIVPLDLIGLKLKPGDSLKIDVGYLFGNAPGTQVAARAYWVNNSFSANVTADVPNESRLEPAEWGSATVE